MSIYIYIYREREKSKRRELASVPPIGGSEKGGSGKHATCLKWLNGDLNVTSR